MAGIRNGACFLFCLALGTLTPAISVRAAEEQSSGARELELIEILRTDTPEADKAIACKQLAVYGSEAAVPELARLLTNERLASWSRIALEAIPGPAADDALRLALNSLEGKLLIGVINSLGVRRAATAAEPLAARLGDPDAEVASSAAAALGQIGNDVATAALRKALPGAPAGVRSAVAEGCNLCAERLLSSGRAEDAAKVYDEVRAAEVSRQRVLDATRGAILARGEQGVPLLVETLRSSDKDLNQIALGTARELGSPKVAEALVAELSRATSDRAPLLLAAIADRNDTASLPAVLKAAGSGPKPVRIAALAAVERLGDVSCLSPLLKIATEEDVELVKSAKAALAGLAGEKINAEIVARLPKAEGKSYPLLIELVGERRISATPELLKALDHRDGSVRSAALTALGHTVDSKGMSVLIAQVVKPRNAEDAAAAQSALKAAAVRMPDREACAEELAAAARRAPVATHAALLQILGTMGGSKALETIGAAAKQADPQLQDAATRLLGEWMNVDAGPVLLELARTDGHKYQIRALRGYIRLVRQFTLPDEQRAEMCRQALEVSAQPAEQKLVLDVMRRYPSLATLKLAIQARSAAELKEDATAATLAIAQKLSGQAKEVRELLSGAGIEPVKLEIVKAEYGSGGTQRDVTEVLRKVAGDLPILALAAPNYNAAFGGDPAPGSPKKLKISYKINGQPAEATFDENALIILALPK